MSPTSNPVTSPSSTAPPAAPALSSDPLANESTFLTLLVSQLKNQDPLNPPDTNQFVAQLTSYSQLEQLIGIDKNTTPPATATAAANTTKPNTTSTTGI